MIILKVTEDVEKCLDIHDKSYKRINEILEIPVFFDSTEVRSVINEITNVRNSLLLVAQKLSSYGTNEKRTKDEDK